MTYNPNHDRDYWRCEPDSVLIEAAFDSGHELAIALGERLNQCDGMAYELEDLRDTLAVVRRERDELLAELAQCEAALQALDADY